MKGEYTIMIDVPGGRLRVQAIGRKVIETTLFDSSGEQIARLTEKSWATRSIYRRWLCALRRDAENHWKEIK